MRCSIFVALWVWVHYVSVSDDCCCDRYIPPVISLNIGNSRLSVWPYRPILGIYETLRYTHTYIHRELELLKMSVE